MGEIHDTCEFYASMYEVQIPSFVKKTYVVKCIIS